MKGEGLPFVEAEVVAGRRVWQQGEKGPKSTAIALNQSWLRKMIVRQVDSALRLMKKLNMRGSKKGARKLSFAETDHFDIIADVV